MVIFHSKFLSLFSQGTFQSKAPKATIASQLLFDTLSFPEKKLSITVTPDDKNLFSVYNWHRRLFLFFPNQKWSFVIAKDNILQLKASSGLCFVLK